METIYEAIFVGLNWWQRLLILPLITMCYVMGRCAIIWWEQVKVEQWKKQLENDN